MNYDLRGVKHGFRASSSVCPANVPSRRPRFHALVSFGRFIGNLEEHTPHGDWVRILVCKRMTSYRLLFFLFQSLMALYNTTLVVQTALPTTSLDSFNKDHLNLFWCKLKKCHPACCTALVSIVQSSRI